MQQKGYIGYIRVSTVKQGTQGVSLQEQYDGIVRYAERNEMSVTVWLQEMVTAAKQGRPVFTQALKLLRNGKADGIILHKLDRGARNLRDWAAIGELSDQGIEVHFVTESLDLQSRGGRLSADIQAVVAADFIRNLRLEVLKGLEGRLKQGLYPFRAPAGYIDNGGGNPKTVDPAKGPLIQRAFNLYATGVHTLDTLCDDLNRTGLRNRRGGSMRANHLSLILNNPFYYGVIRVKGNDQAFLGNHQPLISKGLYDRVQNILRGKSNGRNAGHQFLFRRMLRCGTCGYALNGERQKGHVYYRCHTTPCPVTCVREENVSIAVDRFLAQIQFGADEKLYFKTRILDLEKSWASRQQDELKAARLRHAQLKDRLNRLTDAYLDGSIDKSMLDDRKNSLLSELKLSDECVKRLENPGGTKPNGLEQFLELAGSAWLSHQAAEIDEKREMLRILTSNLSVHGKELVIEPSIPFGDIANRFKSPEGAPNRDIPRTWDQIIDTLLRLNRQGALPDLAATPGFLRYQSNDERSTQPRQDGRFCRQRQVNPNSNQSPAS